jgi:hypothetical protein
MPQQEQYKYCTAECLLRLQVATAYDQIFYNSPNFYNISGTVLVLEYDDIEISDYFLKLHPIYYMNLEKNRIWIPSSARNTRRSARSSHCVRWRTYIINSRRFRHSQVVVSVIMEIDAPRHLTLRENSVFVVCATAGEGNDRAANIIGNQDRSVDGRYRKSIVHHRQGRSSSVSGSEGDLHHGLEQGSC